MQTFRMLTLVFEREGKSFERDRTDWTPPEEAQATLQALCYPIGVMLLAGVADNEVTGPRANSYPGDRRYTATTRGIFTNDNRPAYPTQLYFSPIVSLLLKVRASLQTPTRNYYIGCLNKTSMTTSPPSP